MAAENNNNNNFTTLNGNKWTLELVQKTVNAPEWPWNTPQRSKQNGDCLICAETTDVYSLGCSHLVCAECLAKHFSNEFDVKRRRYFMIFF